MSKRIVVDPITRIEGHLRIEAEMDGGAIREAYSSGTQVRGIEIILRGRDPRDAWAFTQRVCGVCTLVHGIASVRAVENALGYSIPRNAELIRNLMIIAQFVQDHVMHFYHLHALDWVDVVSALDADPKATAALSVSLQGDALASPGYFADVQARLKGFVEGGQLGIFANGYWGHPEYKLPPEANLMALAHYLEALEWQREVAKVLTIFGGKNPHPNFLVGGVPCPIDLNSDTAINAMRFAEVQDLVERMRSFVEKVYLPDTIAIGSFYKDWFKQGEGVGNFLTYGDLPQGSSSGPPFIPRGAILDRDLSTIHGVDLNDKDQIREEVSHSWYEYEEGQNAALHPYDGETKLNYTGPDPPYEQLNVDESYSWLKTPRWKGRPMEVGPLSRVLMLYASGNAQTVDLVDSTLRRLDLPIEALFSTMGRLAARTLESRLYVDLAQSTLDELVANVKAGDTRTFNEQSWEPSSWPSQARGVGYMEAPRGALAHWITIEDEKIANYQLVVPTTWNASPRDAKGQAGPYEASLKGHSVHDPMQPLEIQRTIHSFDPCLACAVHLTDPNSEERIRVRLR